MDAILRESQRERERKPERDNNSTGESENEISLGFRCTSSHIKGISRQALLGFKSCFLYSEYTMGVFLQKRSLSRFREMKDALGSPYAPVGRVKVGAVSFLGCRLGMYYGKSLLPCIKTIVCVPASTQDVRKLVLLSFPQIAVTR